MDMLLYAILNKKIKNSGSGTVDLSEYAKKEDLVGQKTAEGGEIFNRGTAATGSNSHSEGLGTTASGSDSHAEGNATKASGWTAHSEGCGTIAAGYYSHAEGNGTKVYGNNSHAEGAATIAAGDYQHVQGKFNVEDSESKYAFIIGNGDGDSNRSNAIAIDWDGLIYLNNSDTGIDLSDLSTKDEVADAIKYAHNHENKETLDGVTSERIAVWDAAAESIGDIQVALSRIVEV